MLPDSTSAFAPPLTVAIVIPCYNAEGTIAAAIDSVVKQSFSDWSLIVVDDGSSDSSPQILEEYSQSFGDKISVLSSPHLGACHARNLGVMHATTALVAFLDSDDYWHPSKLEKQIGYLRANPAVIGVTTGFRKVFIDSGRASNKFFFDWSQAALNDWALLGKRAPALNSTLVVYTEIFRSVGGFDENLVSFAEDLDLSWRLVAIGEIRSLAECCVSVTISTTQNHRNLAGMVEALEIFYSKISRRDPELARRGKANLEIYRAMRLVLGGKVREGLPALARCLVTSPLGVMRYFANRLGKERASKGVNVQL